MATRIDWKLSVTPIVGLAATGEAAASADVLSADIKGSIGGGNSSGTWSGENTGEWDDGACTHATSDDIADPSATAWTITTSSADGIFIKNSGFDYDATVITGNNINRGTTTVAEDANETVNVTVNTKVIAKLKGGECIFLPDPEDITITAPASGSNPIALQIATLT